MDSIIIDVGFGSGVDRQVKNLTLCSKGRLTVNFMVLRLVSLIPNWDGWGYWAIKKQKHELNKPGLA